MKKFFKVVYDNLFTIFVCSLFLGGVGYGYYCNFIEPNEIKQEVTALPLITQMRLYEQWEMSHISFDGSRTKEVNPYGNVDEPCYELTTKLGERFDYDYGTEAVILAKKCERYAEYDKTRAKYLADKEAEELAFEKREQAEADALDRLNDKPCN